MLCARLLSHYTRYVGVVSVTQRAIEQGAERKLHAKRLVESCICPRLSCFRHNQMSGAKRAIVLLYSDSLLGGFVLYNKSLYTWMGF